jgi:hypothetical protein
MPKFIAPDKNRFKEVFQQCKFRILKFLLPNGKKFKMFFQRCKFKTPKFTLSDKKIFFIAIAVFFTGIVFLPKNAFRLTKTKIIFSQNRINQSYKNELNSVITEFQTNNPYAIVKYTDNNADIISFETPKYIETKFHHNIEHTTEITVSINPLFYNIDLLKECNLDRPPKTREDFIAAAKLALEKHENLSGMPVSSNVFQDILPWFWAAGIKPETAKDIWTSKVSVETFLFLKQLYDEKIISGNFEKTNEDKLYDFISGKCLFFIGSSVDIQFIKETVPELNFSITTIPAPADYLGKPVFNITSLNIGVLSSSTKNDAVLQFAEFIKKKRGALAAASWSIPGNRTNSTHSSSGDPIYKKAGILYSGSNVIFDVDVFPDTIKAANIFKIELENMWNNGQTPAETAKSVQENLFSAQAE